MKQDILFANVDLDIESNEDLQYLINCFGDEVDVLHHDQLENGNNFAVLEFHLNAVEAGIKGEPDITISAFCSLIENLPLESQKTWNNCLEKRFNIGFESGNTEKRFNAEIKPETVKRVAGIGASIVITIYPI
ncbi:MAG: hypothetical protein LH614_18350, partial [Pyrinomonadaceae bacterium]|nr:hypothetical protein [Pyrinomonadaceae bacterium]